jgi:hypothetical protein
MKILCISDESDPLVYSKNLKSRYGDVDLVISAGDLPTKYYEFIVSMINKDLYFVFGNHNLENMGQYTKEYMGYRQELPVGTIQGCGGIYIDGKVMRDKKSGLLIAGLGGSIRYNKGKNQFTDKEMRHRIWAMAPHLIWNKIRYGRYLDILVTHAPPLGLNDDTDACHRGFASFLFFIRTFKPKYLLHGHVHLTDLNSPRKVIYGQTQVINIYQKYILDDPDLGKGSAK